MDWEDLTIRQIGLSRDALAGRVAVVTGGGRGIGREVAIAFAWLGASVVIAEVSSAGRETARVIEDAGGRALCVETDVSSETSVADLARRTMEAFGPADVLINNAIVCPVGSVLELDAALWDQVVAVNLRGTFLTCKAFLPQMLARRGGTIVNMISTDAMPFLSAYIASKQGIAGFSQSLAAELGPDGVRVIAFAPGMVDTPGLRAAAQELAPRLGMTSDEFLGMAIAIPPAAAAVVFLVVVLADEYHGEQVDVYTVLERAGFSTLPGSPETASVCEAKAALETAVGRDEALRQAVMLSERLQEVVAETAEEFDQLPVFVRPMAQRGLSKKTGRRCKDWIRLTVELTERLKKMRAADATAEAEFHAERSRLKSLLEGLMRYYHEAPAETARFSKDAEFVTRVAEMMGEREAVAGDLLSALDVI